MAERSTRRGAGLLLRGESVIAAGAILALAFVLAAIIIAAWWTMRAQERAHLVRESQRIEQIAVLVASGLVHSLTDSDWSAVRRFVSDVGIRAELELIRLEFADGAVLASSAPAEIMNGAPPDAWPPIDAVAEPGFTVERVETGAGEDGPWVAVTGVITIPDRGPLRLIVRGAPMAPSSATSGAEVGFAAVGVVGLAALLGVYHTVRRRLAIMLGVRDAILRCADGDRDTAALRMAPAHGPEARAWNAVLDALESQHDRELDADLQAASDAIGSRASDLHPACDSMPIGVVVLDAANRISYANGAAAILLERRREELRGAAFGAIEPPPEVVELVRSAAAGEGGGRALLELDIRGDGSSIVRFLARRIQHVEPAMTLLLIEDVTQQRVADRSRSEFVAHVTHELRTPLTNIRLYVEEAVECGDDPTIRARCLNVLNQEARRLERIVGDMLSVAEIEAGSVKLQWGEIRLEPLFAELEADYRPQALDKRIELRFELPPKFPIMWGDRDKLLLALHNLVGNALKYTPDGGSVVVRADADDAQLRVEIADTGIGIAPDECDRVFERFYRAEDERVGKIKGTGIGLSLARELARIHGGDITLESELNKGSVFTLTAPTARRAA